MALSDIKSKIEAEAQREVKDIISKAEQEVVHLKEDAKKKVDEINKLYSGRFEKERPEILRRREIAANLDVARIQLGTKQTLIGKSFEEALSILVDLPCDRYLDFVNKLLKKAVCTGNEIMFVGGSENKITQDWLNEFNSKNNTELTLSNDRFPIRGGFILKNERIDTNCSFEMLIRWARDDIEANLAAKLFVENGGEKQKAPAKSGNKR